MMTLYWSDVLAPRKACGVARHLGSDIAFVYLDIAKGEQKRPDYIALNPHGTVPTLVDGDRVIWEADAIMCHLSNRAGADLWPHDDRQIDVIRWLSWNSQHFMRCGGTLYFEHVIKPRFRLGPPDRANVANAQEDFRRFGAVLDSHLDGRIWLVGDRLSVADFAVSACLPYAADTGMPLDEFPAIQRWLDRLRAIDAWREPFPPIPEHTRTLQESTA